jgi:hypothetical protein
LISPLHDIDVFPLMVIFPSILNTPNSILRLQGIFRVFGCSSLGGFGRSIFGERTFESILQKPPIEGLQSRSRLSRKRDGGGSTLKRAGIQTEDLPMRRPLSGTPGLRCPYCPGAAIHRPGWRFPGSGHCRSPGHCPPLVRVQCSVDLSVMAKYHPRVVATTRSPPRCTALSAQQAVL